MRTKSYYHQKVLKQIRKTAVVRDDTACFSLRKWCNGTLTVQWHINGAMTHLRCNGTLTVQ